VVNKSKMIPTNCYKLQTDQKMTKRPLTQQNTPPKKKKELMQVQLSTVIHMISQPGYL